MSCFDWEGTAEWSIG